MLPWKHILLFKLKVVSFFKMLPKNVPIFYHENFNSNVTKKMWNKCMYDVYLEIIKWCHVLGFNPICRVFLLSHFCLESIIYNLSCAPLALMNMLNHNKRVVFISNMKNKNNENILLWFFSKPQLWFYQISHPWNKDFNLIYSHTWNQWLWPHC
jgi:hypothetical protein